ncbi:MAG: hemerythrin domain-containing protein [Burkholderiales bacterium]|nr:hemerythrin domain-containing protein [Burkholderiales bacterium]
MSRAALQIIRDEHTAVAAVLRSILAMLETGPGDHPERFFDVLRAMLFYIDEFPERRHHPKESDVLFPMVVRVAPELKPVIDQLDNDHLLGEGRVRELQHMLLAWELLGDGRRQQFTHTAQGYVRFYLDHMHVEEQQVIPAAMEKLGDDDWAQIDAAFMERRDPLAGGERDPSYDRLFTRIVLKAPAPIGVGPELDA